MAGAPGLPAATATWCAAASSTRSWPRTPSTAGATLLAGHRGGRARSSTAASCAAPWCSDKDGGATAEIRARYVVVADGANSRFGRALGTFRTREWPYGTAIRTLLGDARCTPSRGSSRRSTCKDRNGNPMPGYGWIFPVGDGTVNIGVGLLSTFRDFKSVNTTHLLDAYAHRSPSDWEIDPEQPDVQADRAGGIPMGGSVGPKAGPTYLVVGDAAGSVNPFNGEGIDYAYETGRMAAEVLARGARRPATRTALQRYPKLLDEEYGQYFKVARLFARVIGRPALMRELTRVGHAQPHADGVGAADHGQPAAPRRARPGRGRLQGRRQARQARPQRLTARLGALALRMTARPRMAPQAVRMDRARWATGGTCCEVGGAERAAGADLVADRPLDHLRRGGSATPGGPRRDRRGARRSAPVRRRRRTPPAAAPRRRQRRVVALRGEVGEIRVEQRRTSHRRDDPQPCRRALGVVLDRPPDRRRPSTASSSRNCHDWNPLDASSRTRNPENSRGVIVSSTSIWATTTLRIVRIRRSVRIECDVSPASSNACRWASSCSSCLNHSS